MKSLKLTRRNALLASTGLLAGSLFLPSRARAQTAPPKRLVIFYTQHGTVHDNWAMPAGDITALSESEFSPILAPLHAFREKLLVIDGLSMATAEAEAAGNGHDIGTRHSLTGAMMVNGAGGGPSIDQLVAQEIRATGRIDSLELAVVSALNGGAVWRDAGQSIPPDSSVSSVFGRVFPPQQGQGELTNADRVRQAQPSVLDLVAREYELISPKLAKADRLKLDLHRDLVRNVESRLVELANLECTSPAQPDVDNQGGSSGFYQSRADAMFEIVAAALACDLTRVVTIQMGQLFNDQIGAPPGDVHAEYAHQQDQNPTAKAFMTEYGRVHSTQFAQLLALLDAIPEGNGTLLDSCAVVWCGELADGVHRYRPWPVVVGGGVMPAGRVVSLPQLTPNPSRNVTFPDYTPLIGPPHNRFWQTVASAVGANLPSVGVTSLTTPQAVNIPCTGVIEELT